MLIRNGKFTAIHVPLIQQAPLLHNNNQSILNSLHEFNNKNMKYVQIDKFAEKMISVKVNKDVLYGANFTKGGRSTQTACKREEHTFTTRDPDWDSKP